MASHDMNTTPLWLRAFVRESNRIENIRDTIGADIKAHEKLLGLKKVYVPDLEMFVRTITRDHVLRDKVGLDVMIGGHLPPVGGPEIRLTLACILEDLGFHSPFKNHLLYENLHPFTDGNGRSGRALWLWQMMNSGLASRIDQVAQKSFLEIFARQAEKADYDLFTAKRSLYYSVLNQGSK